MHSIVVLCAGLFKHLPVCYIYAAHATKEKYSRLGFSTRNDFVIPAPVDYRIKWSNKFGKGPRLRVGLLGNINPNKGQIRLVELAELADREGCDIEFVFAGFVQESQQGYFDSVINTINIKKLKNIKYIGGLNDVNTFFERVDVSLCLSQYESSPQSVWESLAAGRIVISTMVGDVVKVINSGENGYLINLDEPEKILTLLSLVQKMPDKQRKKISLNAQNSLGPFSLMNVSEIHLKAYEFAVDHKNFRTGVGL
jgi:glycosyltransferase involved in cell wall biosynthesis